MKEKVYRKIAEEKLPRNIVDGYRPYAIMRSGKRDRKYASTGIVTEILVKLVEQNRVDKVVVPTKVNMEYNLILTNNIQRIRDSADSFYEDFEYNNKFSNMILKEIIAKRVRFATVTLPCAYKYLAKVCQMQGVRECWKYSFVLLCGGQWRTGTIREFCEIEGINYGELKDVSFRREGLGGITLKLPDKIYAYTKKENNWMNTIFRKKKCNYCRLFIFEGPDGFFGDSWKIANNGSILIIKKCKEKELLDLAGQRIFKARKIGFENVIHSQLNLFLRKYGKKYMPLKCLSRNKNVKYIGKMNQLVNKLYGVYNLFEALRR